MRGGIEVARQTTRPAIEHASVRARRRSETAADHPLAVRGRTLPPVVQSALHSDEVIGIERVVVA